MNTASKILEGFKRGPSIEMSTWYKGILTSQLATEQDTGGAFDIVMSYMRSGTEPPPHVHEREHEFFYVLEGELEGFIADKCFRVSKGECVFSPGLRATRIQDPVSRDTYVSADHTGRLSERYQRHGNTSPDVRYTSGRGLHLRKYESERDDAGV